MSLIKKISYRAIGLVILLAVVFAFSSLAVSAAEDDADTPDEHLSLIIVVADGKVRRCVISGSVTVEEQLKKLDLSLEQMDTVTPSLGTKLKEGDTINVSRKRIEQVSEVGVIPFETVYTYSPDVLAGEEIVLTEGQDGYGTRTYDVLMVDGVAESRLLVKETLDKNPVTKEVSTGWRSPLVSPFDFEYKFDTNGEPIGAEKILRTQRSSAYSARAGALTASGRPAIVGHVAVNPSIIPYGSKLFVQSSDGKYIYGYCIAADTGLALMDGRVNLDIFYGSYQESVEHGIIWVDIFVLETPPSTEAYGVHTEKISAQ